jgi:hypothetical protein
MVYTFGVGGKVRKQKTGNVTDIQQQGRYLFYAQLRVIPRKLDTCGPPDNGGTKNATHHQE